MVSVEDPTVLADFINFQLENPMASREDSTGRRIYLSRNDFGPLKSLRSIPQLVDFGLATRLEEDDDWGVWPIQADHYRAPEVILGNGWQMETDIWSLGALVRPACHSPKLLTATSTNARAVVGYDQLQRAISAYS